MEGQLVAEFFIEENSLHYSTLEAEKAVQVGTSSANCHFPPSVSDICPLKVLNTEIKSFTRRHVMESLLASN